jgi:hypothetical protein
MTKYHLGVNIRGALKQRNVKGLLSDNGRELSDSDVRDVLLDDFRKGHESFVGDICDNRDPNGNCAGHPDDKANPND